MSTAPDFDPGRAAVLRACALAAADCPLRTTLVTPLGARAGLAARAEFVVAGAGFRAAAGFLAFAGAAAVF